MKLSSLPYFHKTTEAAPLAVFRIFFGLMMFASIIRFWSYGWIDKLYIQPKFFFSYYGLGFIKPLGSLTYLLFAVCGLSALMVALGYRYRLAIITFFLSFTYIELMDKTTYLNHYYFISVMSFLMIFLPAQAYYSVDAHRLPQSSFQRIPQWCIDSVKLMLGIVYFYAGLAKLNSDWLGQAQPLKIWLPGHHDMPIFGTFLENATVHYAFSWGGALYDLCIPFLLLYRKSRPYAFILVVAFHIITRILFPIGMFPYIMIISTLIFFGTDLHHRILTLLSRVLRIDKNYFDNGKVWAPAHPETHRAKVYGLSAFFLIQLLLPFRHLCYPGELFWTEEGYRFSWRVMLMEKAGYAQFKVMDSISGKGFYVDNSDFLTPLQEKQMATQPDFILEYAHYLKNHFSNQGHQNLQIFVESHVALNGRISRLYIDPDVNLAQEKESFRHKTWILPFNDEIKGF